MSLPVGVVLAGGRSSRLGCDKAALRLVRGGAELTLLDWAVRRVAAVCSEVLVAGGDDPDARRSLLAPGRGGVAAVRFVPDAGAPAAGPAAGLLGAAAACPGASLLVLACDLPLVPVELLEVLVREHREPPAAAWVLPVRGGRLEPLCALYTPPALAALAVQVAAGRNALHELAGQPALVRREVVVEGLDELAGAAEPLLNLNSREDLERWRALEDSYR